MAVCVSKQTHPLAFQSMTAQRLGNPAVSVCSSIWYYLALIELSSIPSSSPPSALLLSSFPLLPARHEGMDCQTLFCVLACSVYPGTSISSLSVDLFQYSYFQVFPLFLYLLITSASPLSTCYFSSFSSISTCLFLSQPLSLSLCRQFQFMSGS